MIATREEYIVELISCSRACVLKELEIMRAGVSLLTTVLLLTSLTGLDCFAQRRKKAATPEERAKVVQMAREFEANPLSEEAKEARLWFMKWIKEVPDITVIPCPRLLDPVSESQANYAAGLILQMELSSAAFIIEHPNEAKDRQATFKAGVNGMLKMYEAILKIYPKAGWLFLDSVLEMQKTGKSEEYVREVMAKCSPLPLSDRNKNSYRAGDTVYAPIEVSQKPKIKTRPEPQYSVTAKQHYVEGTVVLQAVLASSGKITDITVIKGLPDGLTEKAIEAARKIKFEPALIENRPVSMLIRLEYNFLLD